MGRPSCRGRAECWNLSLDAWLDRLHVFRDRPWLAWPLVAANLAAVWYGYTDYYANQLRDTDPVLRIFVADSPNAVLAFALALALSQFRLRHALLDLLAWVLNIKVGVWTVFILLYRYDEFFADTGRTASFFAWDLPEPTLRWILFWLHIGMVGQALVLHRDLRMKPPNWIVFGIVAAWILLGDLLDYGSLNLHPILRGPADATIVGGTVLLSAATLALAAAWYMRRPPLARRA